MCNADANIQRIMKNSKIIDIVTNLSLFLLLLMRIRLELLYAILVKFYNTTAHPSWVDSIRQLNDGGNNFDINYAFFLVGILILINRGDLKSLNIDRLFIFIFSYAGFLYCKYYFFPLGWATGLLSLSNAYY